jgi:hypothetical protein
VWRKCITTERLLIPDRKDLVEGKISTIVLNRGGSVRLDAPEPIRFYAHQRFTIVTESDPSVAGPFRVHTYEYVYFFADINDAELTSFHWTPHVDAGKGEKTIAHLHIGSPMLALQTPLLTGAFNKTHIPTRRLSVESIVRFAIEELPVEPKLPDWDRVLEESERQFQQFSRPGF